MRILVTGGAGFIGSAVVRHLIHETSHEVLNVDRLTYAGNLESVAPVADSPRYRFAQADIGDAAAVRDLLAQFRPDAVMNLAAESHVDRSIDGAGAFVQTNIVGTYVLLEEVRRYWGGLDEAAQGRFRLLHVSTDEVYGALPMPDPEAGPGQAPLFTEASRYQPSSPYAASKAAADHLVQAWHRTYGLPTLLTNCSNNYGPYQFPEKLMPLVILNALAGQPLPVYGDGQQVRDWLYVADHARALVRVLEAGEPGAVYNIGGHNERSNLAVVRSLCRLLDELAPESPGYPHAGLITFVEDRPGHDQRYAIDAGRIERELGWAPAETLDSGLEKTVRWYLDNGEWCRRVQDGAYRRERLGAPASALPGQQPRTPLAE